FRAARRALGVLGGLALIVNPALVDHKHGDEPVGSQLSQSGRGGRLRYDGPSLPEGSEAAPVGSADPASVIAAMLKHPDGIKQLRIAIEALTAAKSPVLPQHPDTEEVLDDRYLRWRWLSAGEEERPQIELSPLERYQRLVDGFMGDLSRA